MCELRQEEQDLWDGVTLGDEMRVALAIRDGAYVNTQNDMGETPLRVASQMGHEKIAEMLLRHGATVRCEHLYHLGAQKIAS